MSIEASGDDWISIAATNAVWQHSKHRECCLLALLYIAKRTDANGRNAWPSTTEIARALRLAPNESGRRFVRRIVERLAASGELRIRQGEGPKRRNVYDVCLPGLPPETETPGSVLPGSVVPGPVVQGPVVQESPGSVLPLSRGLCCPPPGVCVAPELSNTSRTIPEPPSFAHADGVGRRRDEEDVAV